MSVPRDAGPPTTAFLGSPRPARRTCFLGALAIAVVYYASFDIQRQPIVTDIRYSLYFAARTADGAVPHRDFFDNRTQLSTLAGAGLYALGRGLGVDPLLAIRVGCLTFAAAIGLLLFAIHHALAHELAHEHERERAGGARRRAPPGRPATGGACAAGLLGLLAYLGFTLLGLLPSIGIFPKLLMALAALAACWLAYRERWGFAGAVAALAALDWQVGALALAAVLVAAALAARARVRACVSAVAGGAAVVAAMGAWLAANGALGAAWRQVVVAAFARGSVALGGETVLDRLARIVTVTVLGCPGHVWLVLVGAVGTAVFPLWLRRHRGLPTARLAIALAVYHYGMVAFSLLDFQLFGDLFALLQSLAFFAGVALVEGLRRIRTFAARRAPADASPWVVRALPAAFVAVVALALAASARRPDVRLNDRTVTPRATLADQRTVASALAERLGEGGLLAVGPSELLFLTGSSNAVPFVYWNAASYSHYRTSPNETSKDTLYRLIATAHPDAVVYPERRLGHEARLEADFSPVTLESPHGEYRVVVLLRRAT